MQVHLRPSRSDLDRNHVAIDTLAELAQNIVGDISVGKGHIVSMRLHIRLLVGQLAVGLWVDSTISQTRTAEWSEVSRDDATASGDSKARWRAMLFEESLRLAALERRGRRWLFARGLVRGDILRRIVGIDNRWTGIFDSL
jgi:hypothetical protein